MKTTIGIYVTINLSIYNTPNKNHLKECPFIRCHRVEVTPDLQAYAAGKNFRSDIRGEDKLEGSPILTNKGQRALESFSRMADVDGPSQGRQKIQRTTAADEINPHNLNVPSVYTDGANVNTEVSLSPSSNNSNNFNFI